MFVTNYSYCESVRTENGKTVIVNPLTMLMPYTVPSNFSFFFTVGIQEIPLEGGGMISWSFYTPNEDLILGDKLALPKVPQEAIRDGKAGIQLNIGLQNVLLKEKGMYKMVLCLDDKKFHECTIEVVPDVGDFNE